MTKEIRLNAFDMNCVGHIQHGMWTHPRDHSTEYNTIEYWQGLARLAERGKFDGIFLADIVGVYDVYRGGPAPSIVDAVQIPVNDPMMVVPVMAAVTEYIGFGVTANLTYEPPYLFARRMSTLDHLTRGRVGWNIVTGYLDSAARGMGLAAQPDHDRRYDAADEYMSVVYQLWEASWEDAANPFHRSRAHVKDGVLSTSVIITARTASGCRYPASPRPFVPNPTGSTKRITTLTDHMGRGVGWTSIDSARWSARASLPPSTIRRSSRKSVLASAGAAPNGRASLIFVLTYDLRRPEKSPVRPRKPRRSSFSTASKNPSEAATVGAGNFQRSCRQ